MVSNNAIWWEQIKLAILSNLFTNPLRNVTWLAQSAQPKLLSIDKRKKFFRSMRDNTFIKIEMLGVRYKICATCFIDIYRLWDWVQWFLSLKIWFEIKGYFKYWRFLKQRIASKKCYFDYPKSWLLPSFSWKDKCACRGCEWLRFATRQRVVILMMS